MATQAERDAGFVVAKQDIIAIVRQLVPSFFESEAEDQIQEHLDLIKKVVNDVLVAAEKVRSTPTK